MACRSLNIVRTSALWVKGGGVVVSVRKAGFVHGSQRGQGMVEYALILVLVSIVVIVILLTMGNQIANVFSNVVAALG
jgi:pilus assembly protein Flp/PilA